MDITIHYIPNDENKWTVTRAIAAVLHSREFAPSEDERVINFGVVLKQSAAGGVRNDGTGTLTIPSVQDGKKFLSYVRDNPIKMAKKKLKFFKSNNSPPKWAALTLAKTPFVSPDVEEEHAEKLWALEDKLRVDAIQFGIFYRPSYPGRRAFSIEWDRSYAPESMGWLKFEYDHKLIRIILGNELTEKIGSSIAINFASIKKIGVGYDGKPYICFDTLTPPVMEQIEFHRTIIGDSGVDNRKYKYRIGSLHPGHAVVAPYATQLRVLLYHDRSVDMIEKFVELCRTAGIGNDNLIAQFKGQIQIEALKNEFFAPKRMHSLHKEVAKFRWPVAFQLESLLLNGLLHTEDILTILPHIQALCRRHWRNESGYVGDFLRRFNEALQTRSTQENPESPQKCFQRVLAHFDFAESHLSPGNFRCCHVTFTPTRMILEGPYATQSNRVIRQYPGFENNFIRVDFRDEDRLQYRWDREVDGTSFLRERVGTILKDGFKLAGRQFEFLAYSSSALREHAVWFMTPFEYERVRVDSQSIRDSLGDFKGTELLRMPSKYAARLAQAFTATDPSVDIHRDKWEEVPDLGTEPYLFTDGVGTISEGLGDRIWATLCKGRRDGGVNVVKPSVYQIRFLGYKGVVAVDKELDRHPNGIEMRLRKSMRKFENKKVQVAPIEIAQAFHQPNTCYLNRPLIMVLEDRGTRKEEFQRLQDLAVADARTIDDNIGQFCKILSSHSLGVPYRLQWILKRIQDLGLELEPTHHAPGIDTPFLRKLRKVAMTDVLRDIKHSARIPIQDSYLLVGIADEGPAYVDAGYENVYILPEGFIYACVQKSGDVEPTWLEGSCSISRSPVVHPGDVQRVRAIGKPPEGMLCLFRGLTNVVVLPSVGTRSLASCLGGGDVDGDMFAVICYDPLLPSDHEEPASYESCGTLELDRDSTVDDICDFVVEYINSDVLGLLSDRLLVIADQSKLGIRDEACLRLAELCSQAVDYPKQGIPVDLDSNELPRTLIRCKPDWHAAEVVSPRQTDYYESSRALGYLFRSIILDDAADEHDADKAANNFPPLSDAISQSLMPFVRVYLGASTQPTQQFSETEKSFRRYIGELNYICVTHTLSNTPGVRLLEEEVVAGTILAKCSQKRWRKDRMYRMRLHASTLVGDARRDLLEKDDSLDDLVIGLTRAWRAWEFSHKFNSQPGANSFGLIALGVVFDCLDKLGADLSTVSSG